MSKLTDHYGGVGPGWHAILTMLHTELQQVAPDYGVIQVKEKFGGLRAYISTPGGGEFPAQISPVHREALALEYKYEAASQYVCEQCGQLGTNRPDAQGWYKTYCELHHGNL